MNRFDAGYRVAVLVLMTVILSTAATAGVVGSGTPSSCTQAALAAQIPAGGTVTFNCGSGPQTIALPHTVFIGQTNPKITIDGGDTITLDGTGNIDGIVNIFGSATTLPDVTFKHITITNGNITTGQSAGGAFQNFGKLTLDTVTLTKNHAAGSGGVIFQEPCIGCLDPVLTITHCLFQNNTDSAISMEGGLATVEDSTFSGNTGRSSGAIDISSNSTYTVIMSIDRCTFTGNSATLSSGGAVGVNNLNTGSSVTMTNDTFTGNTATAAGAQGSAIYMDAAPVTITNCTIAGNTAAASGGAVHFTNRKPTAVVNNTIFASNAGGNCTFDGLPSFGGGHNVQFGDSTCSGATVANPLLVSLANNGGPTQTMALGSGSPAIDAGDSGFAPSVDQRGVTRTDGNGDGIVTADIGAFEAPTAPNAPPPIERRRAVKS